MQVALAADNGRRYRYMYMYVCVVYIYTPQIVLHF